MTIPTQLFPVKCFFVQHGDSRFGETVWHECVGICSNYFDNVPPYRGSYYAAREFHLPSFYYPPGKSFYEIQSYAIALKNSPHVEIIDPT